MMYNDIRLLMIVKKLSTKQPQEAKLMQSRTKASLSAGYQIKLIKVCTDGLEMAVCT